MTFEEAQKLALVAGEIDGGCTTCIANWCDRMNASFEDFEWTLTDRKVAVQRWDEIDEEFFSDSLPEVAVSRRGQIGMTLEETAQLLVDILEKYEAWGEVIGAGASFAADDVREALARVKRSPMEGAEV